MYEGVLHLQLGAVQVADRARIRLERETIPNRSANRSAAIALTVVGGSLLLFGLFVADIRDAIKMNH